MWDIEDFMEEYYGYRPNYMLTLKDWVTYKECNKIEEWDYPIDEYVHIAENGIKCVPVRFGDMFHGYDYRFCEIPEK